MTNDLTHAEVETAGTAARFVAGTLTGDELLRFEEHLLECAACCREVELGISLRAAGSGPRARPRRWGWAVIGLAAAAVLVVVTPRTTSDTTRFLALGAVATPPVYLGIPVRADEGHARFDAAMQAYGAGDYPRAAEELRALSAVLDAPPVHFFLGVSAMMMGADSLALAAYDALLAGMESPYHDEGHYYRAKVALRLGMPARAMADLQQVRDTIMRAQADALADSIRALGLR